jgi:hypothetical protein
MQLINQQIIVTLFAHFNNVPTIESDSLEMQMHCKKNAIDFLIGLRVNKLGVLAPPSFGRIL